MITPCYCRRGARLRILERDFAGVSDEVSVITSHATFQCFQVTSFLNDHSLMEIASFLFEHPFRNLNYNSLGGPLPTEIYSLSALQDM